MVLVLTNGEANTEGNVSDGIHPSIDSTAKEFMNTIVWWWWFDMMMMTHHWPCWLNINQWQNGWTLREKKENNFQNKIKIDGCKQKNPIKPVSDVNKVSKLRHHWTVNHPCVETIINHSHPWKHYCRPSLCWGSQLLLLWTIMNPYQSLSTTLSCKHYCRPSLC